MLKKGKKGSSNKENVEKHPKWWKAGDHCQAVYSSDGKFYEAKVTCVDRDRCTVEFVGYGDQETVYARFLKPSAGKKARRRQKKEALSGNASASESGVTTTDCEGESQNGHHEKNESSPPHQVNYNYGPADPYFCPPPAAHIAMPHPVPSISHHHGASCCVPPHPPHVSNAPMLAAPPAPPMPQCPSLANNPSLTAMLVSWYMAGYYTGLHQNQQKDSQCSQRCCGHVNRCCH